MRKSNPEAKKKTNIYSGGKKQRTLEHFNFEKRTPEKTRTNNNNNNNTKKTLFHIEIITSDEEETPQTAENSLPYASHRGSSAHVLQQKSTNLGFTPKRYKIEQSISDKNVEPSLTFSKRAKPLRKELPISTEQSTSKKKVYKFSTPEKQPTAHESFGECPSPSLLSPPSSPLTPSPPPRETASTKQRKAKTGVSIATQKITEMKQNEKKTTQSKTVEKKATKPTKQVTLKFIGQPTVKETKLIEREIDNKGKEKALTESTKTKLKSKEQEIQTEKTKTKRNQKEKLEKKLIEKEKTTKVIKPAKKTQVPTIQVQNEKTLTDKEETTSSSLNDSDSSNSDADSDQLKKIAREAKPAKVSPSKPEKKPIEKKPLKKALLNTRAGKQKAKRSVPSSSSSSPESSSASSLSTSPIKTRKQKTKESLSSSSSSSPNGSASPLLSSSLSNDLPSLSTLLDTPHSRSVSRNYLRDFDTLLLDYEDNLFILSDTSIGKENDSNQQSNLPTNISSEPPKPRAKTLSLQFFSSEVRKAASLTTLFPCSSLENRPSAATIQNPMAQRHWQRHSFPKQLSEYFLSQILSCQNHSEAVSWFNTFAEMALGEEFSFFDACSTHLAGNHRNKTKSSGPFISFEDFHKGLAFFGGRFSANWQTVQTEVVECSEKPPTLFFSLNLILLIRLIEISILSRPEKFTKDEIVLCIERLCQIQLDNNIGHQIRLACRLSISGLLLALEAATPKPDRAGLVLKVAKLLFALVQGHGQEHFLPLVHSLPVSSSLGAAIRPHLAMMMCCTLSNCKASQKLQTQILKPSEAAAFLVEILQGVHISQETVYHELIVLCALMDVACSQFKDMSILSAKKGVRDTLKTINSQIRDTMGLNPDLTRTKDILLSLTTRIELFRNFSKGSSSTSHSKLQ